MTWGEWQVYLWTQKFLLFKNKKVLLKLRRICLCFIARSRGTFGQQLQTKSRQGYRHRHVHRCTLRLHSKTAIPSNADCRRKVQKRCDDHSCTDNSSTNNPFANNSAANNSYNKNSFTDNSYTGNSSTSNSSTNNSSTNNSSINKIFYRHFIYCWPNHSNLQT
jgi:hypothetical protein